MLTKIQIFSLWLWC